MIVTTMRTTLLLALAPAALAQRRHGGGSHDSHSSKCSSVLSEAGPSLTAIPEPDTIISNMAYGYHYNRFTNSADPCAPPEVTGVSAEPFSEWVASYTEWRESMVPEYRRVWEACSRDLEVVSALPVGPDHCSSLAAEITGESRGDDDDDDDDESSAFKGSGGIFAAAALAGLVMAGMLY